MWQFITWFSLVDIFCIGGASVSQIGPNLRGHRLAKKQPVNSSRMVGTAPSNLRGLGLADGSGIGAADKRASV